MAENSTALCLQKQDTSDNQLPFPNGEIHAAGPTDPRSFDSTEQGAAGRLQQSMRKPLSMGELFALPQQEVQWLVEGLFNRHGTSLLIAKPKKGKSTMVRQLAVAIAQGRSFLGRSCVQGEVLYLALEELDTQVQAHFRLLGGTVGDPIHTYTDLRGISHDALRAYVRENRPSLLIVDTLMTLGALKKWNDYQAAADAIRPWHALARETGCHVLLVHHARKTLSDDVLDDVCGSSALGASVDSIFALREEGRNIVFKTGGQRYAAKLEDTVLNLDKERRFFSVVGTRDELTDLGQKNKQERLEGAIIDFVVRNPGCLIEQIKANVPASGKAQADAMRSLRNAGRLMTEGLGRAGDPYRYFASVPREHGTFATHETEAQR